MAHRLGLLLFLAPVLFAAQSVTLSGTAYTINAPSSAPYTDARTFRIEGRIHDFADSSTTRHVLVTPAARIKIRFIKPSSTQLFGFQSDFDNSVEIRCSVAGRTDFVFRIQRTNNGSSGTLSTEVWDVDGSNYCSATGSTSNNNALSMVGSSWSLGESAFSGLEAKVAYLRWYSTTVALGSAPPTNASGGDNGRWELEGNGTDDANGLNWNLSGATFTTTPTYNPALIVTGGTRQTKRTSTTFELDLCSSFSLGPNANLTYLTAFSVARNKEGTIGSPSYTLNDATTCSPAVSVGAFGTYDFTVTITDDDMNSTATTVSIGGVPTDSNGVLTGLSTEWSLLIGPQLIHGEGPWNFYTTQSLTNSAAYDDLPVLPGETPLAGTITITTGSSTITGSGTTFQSTFGCNGSDYIVVHYPRSAGGTGRRLATVNSCASNTSMTITMFGGGSWPSLWGATDCSSGCAGVSYGRAFDGANGVADSTGGWFATSSDSWNYYDVVIALYRLYWTTGHDIHLTRARTLADRWWRSKYLDRGSSATTSMQSPPRGAGLIGMMARAEDLKDGGDTTASNLMWDGIARFVDAYKAPWLDNPAGPGFTAGYVYDMREQGYTLWFHVLGSQLHYDATTRSNWQTTATNNVNNYWIPRQRVSGPATGGWLHIDSEFGNGFVGTGTFWLYWVVMRAMIQLYEITGTQSIYDSIANMATWFVTDFYTGSNTGISTSTTNCRGVYYSTQWTKVNDGATPDTCTNGTCQILGSCALGQSTGMGSRTAALPSIYLAGWMYEKTGLAAWKTRGDDLFAAAMGKGQGPGADSDRSNYDDITVYGFFSGGLGKEFGECSGAPSCESYLAFRLGQPAPPPPSHGAALSGGTVNGGRVK